VEIALRLGVALWRFWQMHSHLREGIGWLERIAAVGSAGRKELLAWIIYAAAGLRLWGERGQAADMYHEALGLFRELGDKLGIAWCLNDLAVLAHEWGELQRADALYEESLALKKELGDKRDVVITLGNIAVLARTRGDYEQAFERGEESLAWLRSLGNEVDRRTLVNNLGNVGALALHFKDHQKAQMRYEEGLILARDLGEKLLIGDCLAGLGGLAASAEQWERSARLIGAAEALLQEAGGSAMWAVDRVELERSKSAARTHLGEAAWGSAWAEGQAAAMEDAIRFALENVPLPTPEPASAQPSQIQPTEVGKPYPNNLTHREVEVLRLVSQGLSNPQIAEQLYLSRNTVEVHLRSIFRKLNVTTRTTATRFALEHSLA
jgi:ATP/maltotriose-dependent transcriptional regulator MalT